MHPGVLSMIYKVITDAKRANMPVSVCGEMAGEPKLTRLLLAMGLEDFSMHTSQLLTVKRELLKSDVSKLEEELQTILSTFEPLAQAQLIENLTQL
jgi:phosphotransferase system enzyme I (PtsI)